MTSIATGTTLR